MTGEGPPLGLAHAVLAAWVPFTLLLFAVLRTTRAAIVSVVAASLLLPELAMFDFPTLPPIEKLALGPLGAFLGCLVFAPRKVFSVRPGRLYTILILVLLGSAVFTVLGNPEPLRNGPVIRPGLAKYEIISMVVRDLLWIVAPFIVGMVVVEGSRDLRLLARTLLGAGVLYSLPMLLEVRLSPQFHYWVYGFRADFFGETVRWGGYRPVVFMAHGLATALFALVVTLQAAALNKVTRVWLMLPTTLWVVYCGLVLVLCKSTGVIIYGLVMVPLTLWLRARRLVKLAVMVTLLCWIYPLAKMTGAFPEKPMVELALKINPDRAQSLAYRFDNDRMLVQRAQQKLWWGWGGYGRGRVFDADGKDISATDGHWIVMLAGRGVVGMVAGFALLLLPVLAAARAMKQVEDARSRALLAGLAMIVATYGFDLLPNGLFTNIPYFYAGALLRVSRTLPLEREEELVVAAPHQEQA